MLHSACFKIFVSLLLLIASFQSDINTPVVLHESCARCLSASMQDFVVGSYRKVDFDSTNNLFVHFLLRRRPAVQKAS